MFGILFAVLFCSIKKMGLAGEIVNKWHHKALFNRSAIIFIIGLIGVFIYYSQMGIPWLGDADKIRHGFEGRLYGIGFSIQLLQGLNLILASYLIYRLKKSSFFHIVCFLPFVVFILFVSLVSGYRWPVLIFLLSIFTMYHYIRKRLKINIRSFFIFSLIFLFTFSLLGFAGYLREATKERGEERFLKTVEVFNIPYNYRYIVPAVQAIQIRFVNYTRLTKMVPQEYGFFYGRYILSTVPVVKSVFPMLSPRQTSYYVSQTWFQQEVSPAFTGCGHFYIDFGLGGVLIGFFLLGFFAEKCYLRTIKNQDLLSIAFYCFILWLLFLWLISGINIGDLLPGIMALAIDKLIRLK